MESVIRFQSRCKVVIRMLLPSNSPPPFHHGERYHHPPSAPLHHSPHPIHEKSQLNLPVLSLSSPSPWSLPIISLLIYCKSLLVSLFQPIIYSLSSSQSDTLKYKIGYVTSLPKILQWLTITFRIKPNASPGPTRSGPRLLLKTQPLSYHSFPLLSFSSPCVLPLTCPHISASGPLHVLFLLVPLSSLLAG